jgi:hypothetical protein
METSVAEQHRLSAAPNSIIIKYVAPAPSFEVV